MKINSSAENLTLLKDTSSNMDHLSIKELKQQYKKKQISIQHLQNSVSQYRNQIRKLSDNVSKIIQKKLTKVQIDRPNLYPGSSDKIIKLYQDRDNIHNQITQTKDKIKQIKQKSQQQLTQQIIKKKNTIEQINQQIIAAKQKKTYLENDFNQSKKRLQDLNNSQYLKDIQDREKQLEDIRKQIKVKQRQYYAIFNQQVYNQMYTYQIKDYVGKNKEQPQLKQVSQKQINDAINELNSCLEQKKKIQKQHQHIIFLKNKQIQNQTKLNTQLEKQIRQIINQSLKVDLQQKRYKSEKKKSISHSQLDPQKQKFATMLQKKILEVQKNGKVVKKNKSINNENIIIIGAWNENNNEQIMNDKRTHKKHSQIQQINCINFLINQNTNQIIGIQAIYKDKDQNQIIGNKLYDSNYEIVEKIVQVKCNNLKQIHYCNNESHLLGMMKFIYQSESESININDCGCQDYQLSIKNLENSILKQIQVQLHKKDLMYIIKAIKLKTFIKEIQEKIIIELSNQDEQIINQQANRSYSVSDLNSVKKKVVIRGGTLKKINQSQQIDHRLLLNRKKLV